MKLRNTRVVIRQMDDKIKVLNPLQKAIIPGEGWIHTIRITLNMSLRQLGKKLSITPQSVRDMERREQAGTLSIKSLGEAAAALDMKLVYGFIPNDGSLEKMIERKAYDIAAKIVNRTSVTMKLEGQGNSDERIKEAITELAAEIKTQMPKQLWD
jgi:predicted DNA-binding mobile mystery protein A